jgi:hypothetical protein
VELPEGEHGLCLNPPHLHLHTGQPSQQPHMINDTIA